jgi:hypothetical protein
MNYNLRCLESYLALEPPVTELVEVAETGLTVAYEDRWAGEVFQWLSSGRALSSYCAQPNKPARSLIFEWLQNTDARYDLLRERFHAGLINRALALVDESLDVADEPVMVGPAGMVDGAAVADKKSRVETRLRLAALFDPTRYAPLSKTALQAHVTNNLIVNQQNVTNLTDAQLTEFIAEAERRRLRAEAQAQRAPVNVPQLMEQEP